MPDHSSSSHRGSKSKKSSRSGSRRSPNLDFMNGAQNFTTGEITVRYTDGDYRDRSVKSTHNDYSRHTTHEFYNPNSRAPIFNGTVEGPVTNYEGGFVMTNSRGTVYAESYPNDMREVPQQKASYVKRDKRGNETYVYNQPNSNAPIFNGQVRGPVKNHTDSVCLEGYEKVPEGFMETLEAFNRSKIQSDHRYSRGRNSEPVLPPGHRGPENGSYFGQPMQNEPTEFPYNYQPYGTPVSPPARLRKGQASGAYPTPSSSIGTPGYDSRSGYFPPQGPAQHGYGYESQYGSQNAGGGGSSARSGRRSDVDDWISQTADSLGQFRTQPTEDSSEDSEEGTAPNSHRGWDSGIGGSTKSSGKRRAAESTGHRG